MPSIDDIKKTKKQSSLFKKTEYRPWSTHHKESVKLDMQKNNGISDKTPEDNVLNSYDLEKIWRYLYGAKKLLLKIIVNSIEENNDHYVITYPLSSQRLSEETTLPINTVRSASQRLKHDKIIFYYEQKPGRGGFTRYKIPVRVYKYFLEKFSVKE